MTYKPKAKCTPKEWAAHLAKNRVRWARYYKLNRELVIMRNKWWREDHPATGKRLDHERAAVAKRSARYYQRHRAEIAARRKSRQAYKRPLDGRH